MEAPLLLLLLLLLLQRLLRWRRHLLLAASGDRPPTFVAWRLARRLHTLRLLLPSLWMKQPRLLRRHKFCQLRHGGCQFLDLLAQRGARVSFHPRAEQGSRTTERRRHDDDDDDNEEPSNDWSRRTTRLPNAARDDEAAPNKTAVVRCGTRTSTQAANDEAGKVNFCCAKEQQKERRVHFAPRAHGRNAVSELVSFLKLARLLILYLGQEGGVGGRASATSP